MKKRDQVSVFASNNKVYLLKYQSQNGEFLKGSILMKNKGTSAWIPTQIKLDSINRIEKYPPVISFGNKSQLGEHLQKGDKLKIVLRENRVVYLEFAEQTEENVIGYYEREVNGNRIQTKTKYPIDEIEMLSVIKSDNKKTWLMVGSILFILFIWSAVDSFNHWLDDDWN